MLFAKPPLGAFRRREWDGRPQAPVSPGHLRPTIACGAFWRREWDGRPPRRRSSYDVPERPALTTTSAQRSPAELSGGGSGMVVLLAAARRTTSPSARLSRQPPPNDRLRSFLAEGVGWSSSSPPLVVRRPRAPGSHDNLRPTIACGAFWRREWDSNPRSLSAHRFSRPTPSTARPSLLRRRTAPGGSLPEGPLSRLRVGRTANGGAPAGRTAVVDSPARYEAWSWALSER